MADRQEIRLEIGSSSMRFAAAITTRSSLQPTREHPGPAIPVSPVAIVNVGLLVGTLPLPSLGRVLSLALAGATLALFLPLAGRAVRVGQRRSGATPMS